MKKIILILLVVFVCSITKSQNKMLTIDDAVIGAYRTMYANDLYNIGWRTNDIFTYSKGANLYQQSIKNAKEIMAINGNSLFEITHDSAFNSFVVFPEYRWTTKDICWIKNSNKIAEIDLKANKVLTFLSLPDTADNIELHYKSKMAAYTIENNLWVQYPNGNKVAISNETNKGIVYGKSVHRNEFGIEKGIFWSNSGKLLAFYRMDESMVTQYPIVDISTRIATEKPIRYPMAGMKSHEVLVGVFNTETKNIIYLKTGEPKEQYLTNITWTPDDQYICIAVLNREQNHMKFNMYNAQTGEWVKTLFEEKNDRYVEPLHPAIFISNDQFIWQSQRNGYNHFYLYKTDGTLLKQITKGNWAVIDYLGYQSKTRSIYFISTNPTALERQVYSVNIDNGEMKRLTPERGCHEPIFNDNFSFFIDKYSNLNTPKTINLNDAYGKKIRTILEGKNSLSDYAMPELKLDTIKAADGKTDLYGRIIKPLNFDPAKKYPLILYVYGGPHAQLVQDEWLSGAPLWDFYMAQQGYIVATIDNRGSANRGFEFESCIHRQCGVNEAQDQMEFVKHLIKQGFVDEKRIGVHGWSYGGFMTTTLMTTYPEVFKVGVAGGPVIDWKYYEIMYGERYMDTPQENPEGYEKTSLLNKAKNLKGKLLIIHGYIDDTVVLQHSLAFIEQCIKKGILVDYFIYPKHPHNVRGKDRIHLMKKVTQYFYDFL
ncbi:MAG: DPP IV N-terminal domain-containing protein [Bacteroidales bacterium]|nr:DPP IV N-terminal domain-containing protein [Bacteroidales bacterium]